MMFASIKEGYCVAVRNRFAALFEIAEEEQTPEELWQVKSSVLKTACDNIRKSRCLRKPWLSAQALNIAEERMAKVTGDSEDGRD